MMHTMPPDTSNQSVDENAAERLAQQLGVGAGPILDAEIVEESTTASPGAPVAPTVTTSHGGGANLKQIVANDSGLSGEFEKTKLRLPQFKIVNGSGKLSQQYNQGAVLYADELLWKTPDLTPGFINPSLRFVPVQLHMQWRENLTQEEVAQETMPRTVDTLDEAMSLGGSNQWVNGEKPRWSPCCRAILLLEEPPTTTHSGFAVPADGKNYAPAVYYCSGMAHKEFFDVIRSKLAVAGRKSYENLWELRIAKKTFNFSVFVPSIKYLRDDVIGTELQKVIARLRGVPLEVEQE